eukprot:UN00848
MRVVILMEWEPFYLIIILIAITNLKKVTLSSNFNYQVVIIVNIK